MNPDILKQPIRLPENPFWDVFKRFGRDEMIAMVMNVLGTIFVTWVMSRFTDVWFYTAVIAFAGPVVEKVGFFPAHFKDALELYSTTPVENRGSFGSYFVIAMKNGSVSLLEDILVHDPFYVLFMYLGMRVYPDTPPWLLATVSFVIALFVVAGGEVAVNELRYLIRQLRLKMIGFERERYYEARFFISSEKHPDAVLEKLSEKFGLTLKERGEYHDRYCETVLPEYSGRTVKFRLRNRIVEGEKYYTVQVVYKRAAEIYRSEIGQFRFFPQEKHKYYLVHDESDTLGELLKKSRSLRKMLSNPRQEKHIHFRRTIARDYPNGLFVSIDDVSGDRPFFLVELKVYKNIMLLKEAMRYVMTEFPVIQVTCGKEEMI